MSARHLPGLLLCFGVSGISGVWGIWGVGGVGLGLLAAGCGSTATSETQVCTPACPTGTRCEAGGCVATSPLDLAAGSAGDLAPSGCSPACGGATPVCNAARQCVACAADSDCPLGQLCRGSGAATACLPGCTSDGRCDGGRKCCAGACADVTTDAQNCGACGAACSANHATSSCASGQCATGACNPGWGDCNKDPADGCETNLRVDTANCGSCGSRCSVSHGQPGCGIGGCYLRVCEFGWDDCDARYETGCETSVLSDPKNCGGCGQACAARPNAKLGCQSAACIITSCDRGFLDCDQRVDNGCEINGAIDGKNCGACGNACPMGLVCKGSQCTCPQCNFPNASAKCINNVCILDKCNPGFADCDNDSRNGCEVNLASDPLNCGSCGTVCPQNANVCLNAICTNSPCIGNPKWQQVTCTTGSWVWSRDSAKAKTVADAAANKVLATGCKHGRPQPDLGNGVCSLDGKGWVSTDTFVMQGCNQSWWHLGGSFTGQCGGHDGDTWRHLVLTDNDCYDY